ncbi:MAG: UPF0280 family protein [Pseudomonadota bacterium]
MSAGPQAAWLPDGRRLHLHHGPIDLIIDAHGPGRPAALDAARARFEGVLDGLVAVLPTLRRPVSAAPETPHPEDSVARRMIAAVRPHAALVVTPMAAVAGAVADEILAAMRQAPGLTKAYVNNGGDIALHLSPGETFRAAAPAGAIRLDAEDPARGLATSGWRGRSRSLGIADAVTVVAASAAAADVAATLVANAVDLPGHPAIARTPANALDDDSDLGDRPVTTAVGPLAPAETAQALARGAARAARFIETGDILEAALLLNGTIRTAPDASPLRRVRVVEGAGFEPA